MRSDAATVDEYLAEQPENVRADLVQLRDIVRSEMPQALEAMRYGGPVYIREEGGPIVCGFARQKHNLALYVGRVPDGLRERMTAAGFSLGKGAVRFRRLDEEKAALLRTLLRVVVAEGIIVC